MEEGYTFRLKSCIGCCHHNRHKTHPLSFSLKCFPHIFAMKKRRHMDLAGDGFACNSHPTSCSASGQVVVEQSQAEALAAAAAAGDSLICQAIINSGIALGTEEAVVEETSQATEEINKVDSDCPHANEGISEIQVKEEFVELEMETEVRMTHLLNCIVF